MNSVPSQLDIPEYDYFIVLELPMNKFLRRQLGINKAKRVIRNNPNWASQIQTLIKTRKPCSCYMCGHRREYFGETRQEIKSKLIMQETE